MNTKQALSLAGEHLKSLAGKIFDVITVSKPSSLEEATNLSKIISKLSPIIGNMIEFHAVEYLNLQREFEKFGHWKRQDPGFPDALFQGKIEPAPGFEIKAWFPLATEITARFKDSQNHFADDRTHVALLAWLPEHVLFGKPQILAVCIVSGLSVAKARDDHYHNPPDYLVMEPEDTTGRKQNLQQTNTCGYKWQGSEAQFIEAEKVVAKWGKDAKRYLPTREYQKLLRSLTERYPYRLDTNFAKMDRIVHAEIETFKTEVGKIVFNGKPVAEWTKILSDESSEVRQGDLKKLLSL